MLQDIKDEIKESLQNDVRTEIREIEDQRSRVLNLIVFNLNESISRDASERKHYDLDKFIELCTKIGVQ